MAKRFYSLSCIFLMGLFSVASSAWADDGRSKFINPPSVEEDSDENLLFSVRSGFYSSYLFRGVELYSGASIQPSVGVFYDFGDWGTLGGSMWMHIPAENNQDSISFFDQDGNFIELSQNPKFFELDVTLSYDVTVDIATFSVGHTWYTDPGTDQEFVFVNGEEIGVGTIAPDTSEFYAGVALDVLLQPVFTFYHDYRTLEYQYYSLGLSHTETWDCLGEDFNITPFVNFGFSSNSDDDIIIYNSNGLQHINLGLKFDVDWGIFVVTPSFTYTFGTGDSDEDGNERVNDKFIFGVDIAYDVAV